MIDELYIGYYFDSDDQMNAGTFVIPANDMRSPDDVFLAYAKVQGWRVKRDDLQGVFHVQNEMDAKGNVYTITVSKQAKK